MAIETTGPNPGPAEPSARPPGGHRLRTAAKAVGCLVLALLVGTGLGLAALVVVLTAPTGLAGRHEAASYVFAGQLGLVVLAWATDHVRRTLLLLTVLAAGGLQFAHGWLPWWGLQDQGRLFQGTFYWHNQAGIFLAAGALVGYVVVLANRRPLVPLAWVVAPLCTAGVVYTTSRGSQLGVVLGLVLLAGVALAVPQRRQGREAVAGLACDRTARVKRAARRPVDGAGHVARERALAPALARLGVGGLLALSALATAAGSPALSDVTLFTRVEVDFVLTGPISSVSAGHYLAGLLAPFLRELDRLAQ